MFRRIVPIAVLALCIVVPLVAQTDPGVRGGGAAAGNALSSVLANNPATILTFFNDGKARFHPVQYRPPADDVHADYEQLKARGVEFSEAPEERPYGIDSGFRDPSGNSFRLTQVSEMAAP